MERIDSIFWDEWINSVSFDKSRTDNECSGIIEGIFVKQKMNYAICASLRLYVFRRLYSLWKYTRWSDVNISSYMRVPENKKGRVKLILPFDIYEDISRSKASWAWLRGLFGSCGSIFWPKNGYHLVFRIKNDKLCDKLLAFINAKGIKNTFRNRSGSYEVQVRSHESITRLLAGMELMKTSLMVEEKFIIRSVKSRANKQVNCDTSNIRKSLQAAEKQLYISKLLVKSGIINDLPAYMQDLVLVRLNYPSATLREVGQLLLKPVSKSTVEYRWNKLENIIKEMTDIDLDGGFEEVEFSGS